MRWFIIGLVVLGVLAALSAAVLVASLKADVGASTPMTARVSPDVEILVAARDLPAMTVVDAKSIVKKKVPRSAAPEGCFFDVVQVVGKLLALPIVEGQAFTRKYCVTEGSGREIAAALSDGMRAVSFPIPQHSGLDGILYPGSVVDVMMSLDLPSKGGVRGETLSCTLLRGVQVLGIGDRTVVSQGDGGNLQGLDRGRRQMITLMVTSKQAEMLKLALERGTVSLAMRNPLDSAPVSSQGVLISELLPGIFQPSAKAPAALTGPPGPPGAPGAPGAPDAPKIEPPPARGWDLTMIIGGTRETRSVPMPRSANP